MAPYIDIEFEVIPGSGGICNGSGSVDVRSPVSGLDGAIGPKPDCCGQAGVSSGRSIR